MAQTKEFVPYLNHSGDKFLEGSIIRRLFISGDYKSHEYYGIVSHKFFNKIHKSGEFVVRKIKEDKDKPDVFSFFESNPKVNLVLQGNEWHKNFLSIYKILNKKLEWGINFEDESILFEPIFSNHWIANQDVFAEYCEDFLIPVMDLMDNNKILKSLCYSDAKYPSKSKLTPNQCSLIFDRPYYTYHPFIIERLFPIFCYLRNKTVKHI